MWPTAATAVLGLLVFLTARSGVLPTTLRLSSWSDLTNVFSPADEDRAVQPAHPVESPQSPLPLPAVDADGVIRLEKGTTYLAASREFPGSLRIICEKWPTANILVSDGSVWLLKARTVELRGVSLSQQPANHESTEAQGPNHPTQQLLAVLSSALTISGCVIQSPSSADDFAGVAWHRDPGEEGTVMIDDTVFGGGGYAISLTNPPTRCELNNVLLANRGGAVLCEFRSGDTDTWEVLCRNVTQRFGFSLIDVVVHPTGIRRLSLSLTSAECVYEPQMAIIRLRAPATWQPGAMQVQFRAGETGNPAVVPPATQHVVYIDETLGRPVSLPESQITENSLLLADLTFAAFSASGANGSEWSASSLEDFEGPKLTEIMPGIDIKRLPSD